MEKTIFETQLSLKWLIITLLIDFMLIPLFFVGVALIVANLFRFYNTYLQVLMTNRNISFKNKTTSGLTIKTEVLDIPLNKICSLSIHQKSLGQFFNYGDVTISSPTGTMFLKHIPDPYKLREIIYNQIEESQNK